MVSGMDHQLRPLTAPTAPDPYPYYAHLVAERPFYRDDDLGMWIASSARAVEAVFANATLLVRPPHEPVPAQIAGTPSGDLFGRFMRMRDDEQHAHLKRAALQALNDFASTGIDIWAHERAQEFFTRESRQLLSLFPAFAIARALGLGVENSLEAARCAREFAATFSLESARALLEGTRGARGLLAQTFKHAARDLDDAAILANLAGLLFQSCDATAGLIGNALLACRDESTADLHRLIERVARYDSPVQNTRRFAVRETEILENCVRAGEVVLVVIAAANRDPAARRSYTFGSGPHACPGERISAALAVAATQTLLRDRTPALRFTGYRPSENLRIAQFDV